MSNSTGGDVGSDKSATIFDSFQVVKGGKLRDRNYPIDRSKITSGEEFFDVAEVPSDVKLYLTLWGFGEDSFFIDVGIGGMFLGKVGEYMETAERAIEEYGKVEAALDRGRYQLEFTQGYKSIGRPGKLRLILTESDGGL